MKYFLNQQQTTVLSDGYRGRARETDQKFKRFFDENGALWAPLKGVEKKKLYFFLLFEVDLVDSVSACTSFLVSNNFSGLISGEYTQLGGLR